MAKAKMARGHSTRKTSIPRISPLASPARDSVVASDRTDSADQANGESEMADGSSVVAQQLVAFGSAGLRQGTPKSNWHGTVQRWHYEMCRRGQVPELLHLGWSDYTGKVDEQIMCTGNFDYHNDTERQLWYWMREHEDQVRQYLRGLGSYRDITGSKIPSRFRYDWKQRVLKAVNVVSEMESLGLYLLVQPDGRLSVQQDLSDPARSMTMAEWDVRYLPILQENREAVWQEAWRRQQNRQRLVSQISAGLK